MHSITVVLGTIVQRKHFVSLTYAIVPNGVLFQAASHHTHLSSIICQYIFHIANWKGGKCDLYQINSTNLISPSSNHFHLSTIRKRSISRCRVSAYRHFQINIYLLQCQTLNLILSSIYNAVTRDAFLSEFTSHSSQQWREKKKWMLILSRSSEGISRVLDLPEICHVIGNIQNILS